MTEVRKPWQSSKHANCFPSQKLEWLVINTLSIF